MTKVLKKKKLRRAKKRAPQVSLETGTRVVVETLSTSSVADVIWQVRRIIILINFFYLCMCGERKSPYHDCFIGWFSGAGYSFN